MKVSVIDFEGHLMRLIKRIGETMPTSFHKWLGGAMLVKSTVGIEESLAKMADKEGLIELEDVKKLVNGGFEASGGEVVIPFKVDGLLANLVSPVNIKLTKQDADEFFAGF